MKNGSRYLHSFESYKLILKLSAFSRRRVTISIWMWSTATKSRLRPSASVWCRELAGRCHLSGVPPQQSTTQKYSHHSDKPRKIFPFLCPLVLPHQTARRRAREGRREHPTSRAWQRERLRPPRRRLSVRLPLWLAAQARVWPFQWRAADCSYLDSVSRGQPWPPAGYHKGCGGVL